MPSFERSNISRRLAQVLRIAGWVLFWAGVAMTSFLSSDRAGAVLLPLAYGAIALALALAAAWWIER